MDRYDRDHRLEGTLAEARAPSEPIGNSLTRPEPAAASVSTGEPWESPAETASTGELVERVTRLSIALARREVDLARAEAKADLSRGKQTVQSLGVGALSGLLALHLLLVAVVFAFYEGGVLAGWLAALLGAVLLLVVGGAFGLWGWASRVRTPLNMTRNSVQRTARWAKNRAKSL